MLVSSSGLLLNKHYCQGELRSVAVFAKPKTCHEVALGKMMPSCPMHQQMAEGDQAKEDKGCCDNRSAFLKITDQQVLPDVGQKVVAPVFFPVFAAPVAVLSSILPDGWLIARSSWAFDLPPPKVPLRILLQTFRN